MRSFIVVLFVASLCHCVPLPPRRAPFNDYFDYEPARRNFRFPVQPYAAEESRRNEVANNPPVGGSKSVDFSRSGYQPVYKPYEEVRQEPADYYYEQSNYELQNEEEVPLYIDDPVYPKEEHQLKQESFQDAYEPTQNRAEYAGIESHKLYPQSEEYYSNDNVEPAKRDAGNHFDENGVQFAREAAKIEDRTHGGAPGRLAFQIHGQQGPHSYRFGYDTGKGYNRQFRYEEKNGKGEVKGRYGFHDKDGKLQVVNYSAHPKYGFSADVPKYH